MIRLKITLSFLLNIALIVSCDKRLDTSDEAFRSKQKVFQQYNNVLDQCKKLSVDSIEICAQEFLSTHNLNKNEEPVWFEYGKAKAHFHNNLGIKAFGIINLILPKTENYQLLYERAELLELRSILYRNNYKIQQAAEDMYQAADIYQQLNLDQKAASLFSEIAALQYNVGNYALTTEIGNQSFQLYQQITSLNQEDSIRLMRLYNTLALSAYKQNDFDLAKEKFLMSYLMAEALDEEFWMGLVTGNMADIFLKQGMIEKAIENYEYDIKISLKHHEYTSAALSLIRLGSISLSNGELQEAKKFYDSAYVFIQKSGRPVSLSNYHKAISEWHEKKNQPNLSLLHFKKYVHLRDSIQSIEINSQLQRIRNQKEVEGQLADINLLKAENELRAKELLISKISIAAFLVVLILLLVLLYTIRRNYKSLNELNLTLENKVKDRTKKLRKINNELETYLYRASHDVRRPILTILGLVKIADLTSEEERTAIRKTIKATANEMDKMLKKLQMAYELEKRKKETNITVHLNDYIKDKLAFFRDEYPQIVLELIEDDRIDIKTNIIFVDTVFINILENACNFSSKETGHVIVELHKNQNSIQVSVKDNGEGIEQDFHEKIFEPYQRFSNRSAGSGLGLYLVQKAVLKMKGKITVKSQCNKGAEFIVTIPIMK